MCLTVPMKVEEIAGSRARCTAFGEERWVELMLMGEVLPGVGDYVAIRLGFVQQVVPEAEALEAQALFGEVIAVLDADEKAERKAGEH